MSNFPDSLPYGFQPRDVKPQRIEQDHFDEFDPSRHTQCSVHIPVSVANACEAVAKQHGLCLPDVVRELMSRALDFDEVLDAAGRLYADEVYAVKWTKMASDTIREILERNPYATDEQRQELVDVCRYQSIVLMVCVMQERHLQLF